MKKLFKIIGFITVAAALLVAFVAGVYFLGITAAVIASAFGHLVYDIIRFIGVKIKAHRVAVARAKEEKRIAEEMAKAEAEELARLMVEKEIQELAELFGCSVEKARIAYSRLAR